MPPSEAHILDALRPVRDPELRRSIVDLDLVQEVRTGRRGVRVVLGVPAQDYPPAAELRERVRRALAAAGAPDAEVELRPLDEPALEALGQRLRPPGGA